MRGATSDSSEEPLINSRNPDVIVRNDKIKKTNWRSRPLFKTFHLREYSMMQRKSDRPASEELSKWAESLDNLLSSKCGITVFRVFMKSEYCEENVEFWVACEEFRKIKSRAKRRSRAKQLYEEFVREDSPKEINLDFHTKESVLQCLLFPSRSSLKAAQNRVYYLMEHNSYRRFLESDLYHELCKFVEGER
ncbi:regulator of G-protein signaling 2-like isoform X3 [Xyrauchen texanus]|uniref:regulator of G-protein signaling 2-like isoform X3 n=1 Tax=Xyrauchen texanus TaxID=154827 RepID=UPI00224218B3|nr:regulator of G-protein signaling 2-like isoform X3 [Xyrauchen texanus]